jgi:hypothetical protein
LTACWIAVAPLGVSADPGTCASCAGQANNAVASPVPAATKTRSFRDRIRAAFGLPPVTKPDQTARGQAIAQPAGPSVTPQIVQTSYAVSAPAARPQPAPETAPPSTAQIATKFQEMIGHEADYSWITGQLYYVHADGGKWVVRYAHVDEVDRYGGSVVLTPTVEMRNFREGDLVNVCGEILNNGIPVRTLGGALYRVNSIQMVERNDPRW